MPPKTYCNTIISEQTNDEKRNKPTNISTHIQ